MSLFIHPYWRCARTLGSTAHRISIKHRHPPPQRSTPSVKVKWCSTKTEVEEIEGNKEWWHQLKRWEESEQYKQWKELREQDPTYNTPLGFSRKRDGPLKGWRSATTTALYDTSKAGWMFPEEYCDDGRPAKIVVDMNLQMLIWRNKLNGDISRKLPILGEGHYEPFPPHWELHRRRDMTGYEFRQYNMESILWTYCEDDAAEKGLYPTDFSFYHKWAEYYKKVPWGPDHEEIAFEKFMDEQEREWEDRMKREGRDIGD